MRWRWVSVWRWGWMLYSLSGDRLMPLFIGITGDIRAVDEVANYLDKAGGCYSICPDTMQWQAAREVIAEAFDDPNCGLLYVRVFTDDAAEFVRERDGDLIHLRSCADDERPYLDILKSDVILSGDPDTLCMAVRDYIASAQTTEV